MIQARLTRIASHPDHGTFGSLVIDGEPICNTLEPYHRDNERNVSSIPLGQYICKPYTRSNGNQTYEITGIQNRSHVIFHSGNVDDHTMGCVLLGMSFGDIGDSLAVLNSKTAMREFLTSVHGEFQLTIVEAF